MNITKQQLISQIRAYLNHQICVDELVDWAENSLMDGEFPESEATVLASALSRIGLMDVRSFGLNWDDFEDILHEIGYKARVELIPA
jgi:hypothetical protein